MKLRGALIGAGNIALRSHLPQWSGNPALGENVEIVAIADLSTSNLDGAKKVLPGARMYSDVEELLDKEALDFCDICTPPFTHRALIEQVAARGLHIVCEKPLAPTVEEACQIVRAVEGAGIVFQPCHQYHYSPQWQAVRRLIPRIGPVYLAEYEVQRTEANEGNANWSPAWRTDPILSGGGILSDHGAHIFYQLRSVLGEPQRVQATVRTLRHHGYQVEDTALVMLDFGDCLAHMRLSWAARRRQISFRFVGQHGEIVGDDQKLRLHAETSEDVTFPCGLSSNSSHAEWYAPLLLDFVERVQEGTRTLEGLEEAVYVTRVINKAYESSEQGRALLFAPGAEEPEDETALVEDAIATLDLPEDPDGPPMIPSGPVVEEERRRRTRALRGVGLVVLAGAAAWTFHDVHWHSLLGAVSEARPGWLALAAAVNLVVLGFQATRWLALVRPLSSAATLGQAFKAMVVGYTVSTVVPARAGELARIEWLGRYTGLSRMSIVGSVLLDQLVNAAGLLAGVALLPLLLPVPLWMRPGGWFALALFVAGAMTVFALSPVQQVVPRDVKPRGGLPFKGISSFLGKVRTGLVASRDPRALGVSLGASLVAWGLEINVTNISMRAFGLHLPLTASILVLIAVNLALAFPFAPPGNIGTLELGATLALVEFGVPKEQALAFAICYHLLQVVPIGLLGFGLMSRAVSPSRRKER
jgi:uncharacterized protein (TIRG00374 family)